MASITADSSAAATGISSIAVNKDAVVVASTSIPRLLFYGRATHALPEKPQQQQQHQQHLLHDLHLLGGVAVSTQGMSQQVQALHTYDKCRLYNPVHC